MKLKMTKIQLLNARVKTPGIAIAILMLVFGVCTLINGIQRILAWRVAIGNVLISLIGGTSLLLVYPVYRIITNVREERFAPEILLLCNEKISKNAGK